MTVGSAKTFATRETKMHKSAPTLQVNNFSSATKLVLTILIVFYSALRTTMILSRNAHVANLAHVSPYIEKFIFLRKTYFTKIELESHSIISISDDCPCPEFSGTGNLCQIGDLPKIFANRLF